MAESTSQPHSQAGPVDKVEQAIQIMLADDGLIKATVWLDLSNEERALASAGYRARMSPEQQAREAERNARVAVILAERGHDPVTATRAADSGKRNARRRERRAYLGSRAFLADEINRVRMRLNAATHAQAEGWRYWPDPAPITRDLESLETRFSEWDASHGSTCPQCGKTFARGRADQRYCSGRCRVAAFRVTARRSTAAAADVTTEPLQEPDAEPMAYRCSACDEEFTEEDADQDQGPLYECSRCGTTFSRANSADGEGNRCLECGIFGARIADLACPECGEGELESAAEAEAAEAARAEYAAWAEAQIGHGAVTQ